jgi:hypothetical protein
MLRNPQIGPAPSETGAAAMAVLRHVVLRTWARDTLAASTVWLIFAGVGIATGQTALALGVGLVTAGVLLWRGGVERTAAAAARRVERAVPGCHNVVITAEELFRHPDRASPWIRCRVSDDAAVAMRAIRVAAIVPLVRHVAGFLISASLVAALPTGIGRTASQLIRETLATVQNAGTIAASAPVRVVVTITPPPYIRKPARQERDPERIEAIQGSSIRVAVSGAGSAWRVRSASSSLASRVVAGETTVETVASESGYFAVEPIEESAPAGSRRLIPLVVTLDRSPNLRVETPGRDIVLADTKARVTIEASASDDFGLDALEIRYTKVSGSGEQFEFEEGTLPVTVTKDSDVAWKARGQIAMASLKLEPGDALVYRAVARDKRPGDDGLATSDTFFIEIAGPGQVALEGFEMPPDQERYALSQQMIVLKIQRLRARERGMAPAALADAAEAIAAEQRAVRANFIFLMGGHVEDDQTEAEQPSGMQDGRLQNTARKEVSAAVAHMSRAEQTLVAVNTASALAAARAAVEALQRAFGRSRYILRTIPVGSRVDPSRRLTGELSDAGDWRRDLNPPSLDRDTRGARLLLARMLDIASAAQDGRAIDRSVFTSLAEEALAIDPGASVWQDVARRLQQIQAGVPQSTSSQLSDAIGPVLARARRGARLPSQPATRSPAGLEGAWAREFQPREFRR